MAAATPTLRPGESIGDWRIAEWVAIGGMGEVYRALGPDGEEAALKMIRSERRGDERFRDRFAREVEAARRVHHPNLVPVLDDGEHDGVPWLAQRFCSGGNLAERIAATGPLPVPAIAAVAHGVADALGALHSAGIVHRDVCPSNVLFDATGRPLLSDLGLVKDRSGAPLTEPGQAIGAAAYISPEQIRAEQIGPPTDVYGLGCTLWEAACGRPPFADATGMKLLWAHLQETPGDPQQLRPGLPRELADALLAALEKDPARRPRTPDELAGRIGARPGEGA